MTPFASVGVLGAGIMGSGIAQTAAVAGYDTQVRDLDTGSLARGREGIERSLAKLVEKGIVTAGVRDAALARLVFTTDLAALADVDLIIEAVTEDAGIKGAVLGELHGIVRATAVFASNTSSLTISELAAFTAHPDRFVGLHFFNPVPLMPLVEVVRSVRTTPEVVEQAVAFVRSLGKEPIVTRDASGFIVNRLLIPFMLDAIRAVEEGVAAVPDVDIAMRLGAGHPMGPLTLLDLVGLDTVCLAAEHMFTEYREPRFAPPPLLRRLVSSGFLGRKSGRGFYDYRQDPPVPAPLGL